MLLFKIANSNSKLWIPQERWLACPLSHMIIHIHSCMQIQFSHQYISFSCFFFFFLMNEILLSSWLVNGLLHLLSALCSLEDYTGTCSVHVHSRIVLWFIWSADMQVNINFSSSAWNKIQANEMKMCRSNFSQLDLAFHEDWTKNAKPFFILF